MQHQAMTHEMTKPFAVLTNRYQERLHVGFNRASSRNPCPVCGAKKYCQTTRDGRLAHCMKEPVGAVKRAKDGGYVHILTDDSLRSEFSPVKAVSLINDCQPRGTLNQPPLAPLEIRHAAYSKLIALSPASCYARELVTVTPDGLLARGLLPQDAFRFGALPPSVSERDVLARAVSFHIEKVFPEHAGMHKGCGIIGVPGLWLKRGVRAKLGRDYDYKRPALVIPYRNEQGLIGACQLRFAGAKGDYHWLSTPEDRLDKEPFGTSSGCPIHWTRLPAKFINGNDLPILVTEGALKAEVFVRLRPPMRVVATAGVGVAHAEIIQALRGRDVVLGFDSDYRDNPHVCRQLGKLIAVREQDAILHENKNSTSIVVWEGAKGIDDAVLANLHLRVIGTREWFQSLVGKSAEEVAEVWCQMHHMMKT